MRTGVWFIATACVLLCAVIAAHAQTSDADSTVTPPSQSPLSPPGPNPVVAAQDSTYAPRYRFSPVFTNRIGADVSSVGMKNDFHTGFTTPWGSIFDFAISDDEKNYRLQDRFEQTKLMKMNDLHTFNIFWNGMASYSDSRVFSRTVAVGGGAQDFIINDKLANFGSTYKRTFLGARTDLMGSGGGIESERAFKNDQGLQGGVNGGVAYDFGEHVTLQGRAALRGEANQSETTQKTYYGLGSSEDSLSTKMRVAATDSIRFDVSYAQYNGDREFTDQARGSQGAQVGGVENVFREGEHRSSRNTTVTMSSSLMPRVHLGMSVMHDEQQYSYDIQTTRFSRTVTDAVSGNLSYTMPWKTVSSVRFENNETLRDLGEESIASLTDKRKRVAVTLAHNFSKTFLLDFTAYTQIQQSFYLKYAENPRDRDQLDASASVKLTSTPFKKIFATISGVYTTSEFVNIDSTQSENNRTRELWELRPAFTYTVNPRLIIVQNYGLSFEYTDYTYKSTENFLDRNLTFSNEFQYSPTSRISTRFEYAVLIHDNGSYLPDPVTGQEELSVRSKDRRDRTKIRIEYEPITAVGFFAENTYSKVQDITEGVTNASATTDGQIKVGTTVNHDWGAGRTLRLTVSRVKRFSPFGAEAEKNYWDAHSEFSYPF